MAHRIADRVTDATTSTGTGTITLANAPPRTYITVASIPGITPGDTFDYVIQHLLMNQWEVGRGTWAGSHQFTRADADVTAGSSGAGTRVVFSAGTKNVMVTFPAATAADVALKSQNLADLDDATAARGNLDLPSTTTAGRCWRSTADGAEERTPQQAAQDIGSLFAASQAKVGDYTVVAADRGQMIEVDASGGNRTITLPEISDVGEFQIGVQKIDSSANTVTVARAGSDTIEGDTSVVLRFQHQQTTLRARSGATVWRHVGSLPAPNKPFAWAKGVDGDPQFDIWHQICAYAFSTDATLNGLFGGVLQNQATPNFPCGVTAYGKVTTGGEGNEAHALFARADLHVNGMAIGAELNTFNYAASPPGTLPVPLTHGTTEALPVTLILGAGGDHPSHTALLIGPEGSEPNQYLCGIFLKKEGIFSGGYGIYVDADADEGAAVSATLRNTGQGSNTHLFMQTMGSQVDGNFVIDHRDSAGNHTFGVTQDGSVYAGATKAYDQGTYTPTLTGVTNVAASTASVCHWSRVRDRVTVSGMVQMTGSVTTTFTQLGISLPIASNIGAFEDVGGTAATLGNPCFAAGIAGDATNNRAELRTVVPNTANNSYAFSFIYMII